MRIKQGDNVKMLSGKDKGRTGLVVGVLRENSKVIVEGLNLVKKHMKKRDQKSESGIVSKPAAIAISKVQLICPKCGKSTRVKLERTDGKRVRICMKCKSSVERAKGKVKKSASSKSEKKEKGKKKE